MFYVFTCNKTSRRSIVTTVGRLIDLCNLDDPLSYCTIEEYSTQDGREKESECRRKTLEDILIHYRDIFVARDLTDDLIEDCIQCNVIERTMFASGPRGVIAYQLEDSEG